MEMGAKHERHNSKIDLETFVEHQVPRYNYTVPHESLIESCRELLSLIFPKWTTNDAIEVTECKEGITNKRKTSVELLLVAVVVKCENRTVGMTVLVRAYGKKSELIIDRLAELENFVTLCRAGLSPPLYARFVNGFVYGYIPGRPLRVEDMASPHISKLAARKLARWHKVHLPGDPQPRLFKTLWKWYRGIPTSYERADVQEKFAKHVDVNELRRGLERMEGVLRALDSPVVFCHNDLLSANIIYEEDKDDVSFIDFEYGGHNYRGFDIGNHFCEFAGFACDYSRYPGRSFQEDWLRVYWREYSDVEPSREELDRFYLEVNLFALAAHYYWGLWGLMQSAFSDIPFDYMSYAIMRFSQCEQSQDFWLKQVEEPK